MTDPPLCADGQPCVLRAGVREALRRRQEGRSRQAKLASLHEEGRLGKAYGTPEERAEGDRAIMQFFARLNCGHEEVL